MIMSIGLKLRSIRACGRHMAPQVPAVMAADAAAVPGRKVVVLRS